MRHRRFGVKEIPALGEAFDPNVHQAISLKEAEEGSSRALLPAVHAKGLRAGR